MATRVFQSEEIELQDGTTVEIKPLNIKKLRKFMELVKDFDDTGDELENIELMIKACAIVFEATNPQLAADTERLEEALDVPTMWKILEVAGGVKMNDPNLLAAGRLGTT